MNANQVNQLKAQIHAYRFLARNQPLPPNLTAIAFGQNSANTNTGKMATGKFAQKKCFIFGLESTPPDTKKKASLLPEPYSMPGPNFGKTQLPYSLMAIQQLQQQRQARIAPVAKPSGVDPQVLLKEREHRLANRVGLRIRELEEMCTSNLDDAIRLEAEIELRSLRLLNFQRSVSTF